MLIATDGMLPVEPTVEHVQRFYRPGDSVTVMTAIDLPRRFLDQLKDVTASSGVEIDEIVEAAGPGLAGLAGGDRVAERLAPSQVQSRHIEDFVARYRGELGEACTQQMVEALTAVDIEADTLVRETDGQVAAAIMDACREKRIDLLVVGSTGRGRFDGFVGSIGTKLLRHAPCDVFLVRTPPSD